jgi:hypothetical protein
MTSEHAIPALKSTSTNFPFWETTVRRHLDGVGELRVIDLSYRLPTKSVVSRAINPFYVETETSSGISDQTPATTTPGDPILPPPTREETTPIQKWITTTITTTEEIVSTYSPGLDKASGAKEVPYKLINSQMLSLLSRVLDKSLHHLLVVPKNINPLYTAAAVFRTIKTHFSCSAWMNKDNLVRKWEDIRVCTDPEATYNHLLEVNQECTEAGAPYSDFQVASKFVHLLQTADDRAYIHLLTELARMGDNSNILQLWHIAQVTWNQIKVTNARTPPTSQHLGMATQLQATSKRQCLWCTGIGHSSDKCYARNPDNLKLFPNHRWPNGEVPNYMTLKFNKKYTQEEAQKMVRETPPRAPAQYHQASLAWTPPPIFTADPGDNNASSSTNTDRYRQEGRYNFLSPEVITEKELAMEAHTTIGDGFPKLDNLW